MELRVLHFSKGGVNTRSETAEVSLVSSSRNNVPRGWFCQESFNHQGQRGGIVPSLASWFSMTGLNEIPPQITSTLAISQFVLSVFIPLLYSQTLGGRHMWDSLSVDSFVLINFVYILINQDTFHLTLYDIVALDVKITSGTQLFCSSRIMSVMLSTCWLICFCNTMSHLITFGNVPETARLEWFIGPLTMLWWVLAVPFTLVLKLRRLMTLLLLSFMYITGILLLLHVLFICSIVPKAHRINIVHRPPQWSYCNT